MAELTVRQAQEYAKNFGTWTIEKPNKGQPAIPQGYEAEFLITHLTEEVGSLAKVLRIMREKELTGSPVQELPPRLIQEFLHPIIFILKLANYFEVDVGKAYLDHYNKHIAGK